LEVADEYVERDRANEANRWDGWSLPNDCVHKKGKKGILEMEVAGTRKQKRADLKAVKYTRKRPVILQVVRRGEFKLVEFQVAGAQIEQLSAFAQVHEAQLQILSAETLGHCVRFETKRGYSKWQTAKPAIMISHGM
jgi:hypothetical protein